MNLSEVLVQPIGRSEEQRYQHLMQEHHYLGCLPKISETLWYVACWRDQWVALVSFSAAAWKCAARDLWIGWDLRHQYDRLKLLANNSRFLVTVQGGRRYFPKPPLWTGHPHRNLIWEGATE